MAKIQYDNGDTEHILLGNLVRTTAVGDNYLTDLASGLAGDERAALSLRGQPSALDLVRSLRGRTFGYQAAALRKEARKHAGRPLGDRLSQAASDIERLSRGTADSSILGRALGKA